MLPICCGAVSDPVRDGEDDAVLVDAERLG
jgi:hypothetical protein